MAKLHTAEVIKLLGITRVTLDKWVLKGDNIKKVERKEDAVGRPYREFDKNEIMALKKRMLKERINGKPLIEPTKKATPKKRK